MKPPRLRLLSLRWPPSTPARGRAAPCAWRALALIWQRKFRRAAPLAATRTERHFHQRFVLPLHFHLRRDDPNAVGAAAASAAAAHAPRGRACPVASHAGDALRMFALRSVQTHREHRSVHLQTRALQVGRCGMPTPAVAAAAAAQRRTAVGPAPHGAAPHGVLARPAAHSPVRLVRAAVPIDPAGSAASTAGRDGLVDATRMTAPRSPALVWDQPEPAAGGRPRVDAPLSSGAGTTAPPTPRPAGSATGALPPAQFQQLARETQRSLLLDASFAERLADGIMNRVDKRLRIERERRGL